MLSAQRLSSLNLRVYELGGSERHRNRTQFLHLQFLQSAAPPDRLQHGRLHQLDTLQRAHHPDEQHHDLLDGRPAGFQHAVCNQRLCDLH